MAIADDLRNKHLNEVEAALEANLRERKQLLEMREFYMGSEPAAHQPAPTIGVWTGSKTNLFVKIINDSPTPIRVREIIKKAAQYGVMLDSPTAPNTVDGTIRPLTKGANPRIALLGPGLYGSLNLK